MSEPTDPVLQVLEDPKGGFYFLDEDGVRVGNYDTRQGADNALGWFLEDEYWSPEQESA